MILSQLNQTWHQRKPSEDQEETPQQPNNQRQRDQRKLDMEVTKREELKPSLCTSIESLNKFTQKLVFPRDQWTSWTHSLMISSRRLPSNHPNLSDTTKSTPYLLERFNPQSNFFYQENSPNMLSSKEPKLSTNSPQVHKHLFILIYLLKKQIKIFH